MHLQVSVEFALLRVGFGHIDDFIGEDLQQREKIVYAGRPCGNTDGHIQFDRANVGFNFNRNFTVSIERSRDRFKLPGGANIISLALATTGGTFLALSTVAILVAASYSHGRPTPKLPNQKRLTATAPDARGK